ncbi:phytochromobilin:ferredoxin oxidoreductase, chloroplast / phytochromobilin synthase (HY2) isoform X2 [Carex rostrata]
MDLSTLSYQKFVRFALEQTKLRTTLTPLPSQEKFKSIKAKDEKSALKAISFCAPKIRLLRSLTIEDSQSMLVFDFAAFSKPEYDMPIFCANAFTTPSRSIVVLDLNPLYDVTTQHNYKEKYYKKLMPLSEKYSEAWLELIDEAIEEKDKYLISLNCEAQHRYLTWRAEKDPGYPILKKLFGETLAKDLVRQFLFDGVDSLGSKTFLDYFPEYRLENGAVNKRRSMVGKSYETRPWNPQGEFIGGNLNEDL